MLCCRRTNVDRSLMNGIESNLGRSSDASQANRAEQEAPSQNMIVQNRTPIDYHGDDEKSRDHLYPPRKIDFNVGIGMWPIVNQSTMAHKNIQDSPGVNDGLLLINIKIRQQLYQ